MNTGPLLKSPATIAVAPVSEKLRHKAKRKTEIMWGFKIGSVTFLTAVRGGPPRVLAAVSYTLS